MKFSQNGGRFARLLGRVIVALGDRSGNVAAIIAILLVPLIGVLAMGAEVTNWYMVQRAAQNTADTTVIAAATQDANNGGGGTSDYVKYGQSVASQYGFTNGVANDTTVTVTYPSNAVAAVCNKACYEVQVTKTLPIHLIGIVGYKGDATLNAGGAGQKVTAVALATVKIVLAPFCLLSLNGGIVAHGIPNSDLTCNVYANGSADCTGHDLTSGVSDANGAKNSCGTTQLNEPAAADPYAGLESSISSTIKGGTSHCGGSPTYYPDTSGSWPSGTNKITTASAIDGNTEVYCGDVQISGNVVLAAGSATTLIIENGSLDITAGSLLQTSSTSGGLTVIFTGAAGVGSSNSYTGGGQPSNFLEGGGMIDSFAPQSGTWSGISMFQDTNLPLTSTNFAGDAPATKLTGVMDISRTNLTVRGAVNKSSNGQSCFTLVVASLQMDGTGDLMDFPSGQQSGCQQAGVTQLLEPGELIGQLVY
jgi:hypothetical protein